MSNKSFMFQILTVALMFAGPLVFCNATFCQKKSETESNSTIEIYVKKNHSKLFDQFDISNSSEEKLLRFTLKDLEESRAVLNNGGRFPTGIDYGALKSEIEPKVLKCLVVANEKRFAEMCLGRNLDPENIESRVSMILKLKLKKRHDSGKVVFEAHVRYVIGSGATFATVPEVWEFFDDKLKRTQRASDWANAG